MQREPHEVLGVGQSADWREARDAYRALARCFHQDGTAPDPPRMVQLNAAYEALKHARQREGERGHPVAMGPGPATVEANASIARPVAPAPGCLLSRIRAAQRIETPVLDFGQYAGWQIADVAEHDRRYLRWLSRHSSGLRYRRVIEQVLGPDPEIGRRGAILG